MPYNIWGHWYYNQEKPADPFGHTLDYEDDTAGCCAIANISSFPSDRDIVGKDLSKYLAGLKKEVNEKIKGAKDDNCSLLFASLNSNQKEAGKVLESLGFVSAYDGWAIRGRPTSTGVKIYTKVLGKIRKRAPKQEN